MRTLGLFLVASLFTGASGSRFIEVRADEAAPPIFYIEPYWHPSGPTGEAFSLAWQYFLEGDDDVVLARKLSLQLKQGGKLLRKILPSRTGDVLHADLGNLCGEIRNARASGSELQIQIPFESRARTVPSTVCTRELGVGSSDRSKFIFLSDTQEFPDQTENTFKQLRNSDARLILNGGDLVQTGYDEHLWQAYFDATRLIGESHVVVPIVGNHEYRYDPAVALWNRYFGGDADKWFFDFRVGNAQVIVFNSSFEDDPGLISRQLDWMEATLQEPSRYKIVAMHHPPYSESISHFEFAPRQEHQVLRDLFVPLFERYHVDLVLSGHTHLFERSFKEGVEYLVSGAAGGKMGWAGVLNPFALFPARAIRSVTEVSIAEKGLEVTTWNDEGGIEDQFLIPPPLLQ